MSFPDISVLAGFNAGAATGTVLVLDDATRGRLNTATLGSDAVYFSEIGPYVRSFSTNRPSSRVVGPVLHYEAGTSTAILKNADRRFDPTNLDGPYVAAGVSQVQAMRLVKYLATYAGVVYEMSCGNADDWPVSFAKSLRNSEVTLTATDAMKALEANDRAAVAAVGAGEDAGARVTRILDSADVPAADRVIAVGDTTLQATTLAGSVLTELMLVADSELGQIYVDGAGRVVFRNRDAMLTETRSNTSQATFGTEPGELPFFDVKIATDVEQLVNEARITRVGGAEQTASDTTSIDDYLKHSYARADLIMQANSGALDYASFLVYQCKDPELRFSEISIKPMRDPDRLFPQVLGREIGDRITVILRPEAGPIISRDCFISGIAHAVNPETQEWLTTWLLQSATKYAFMTLDNATLGTLDSNALAF